MRQSLYLMTRTRHLTVEVPEGCGVGQARLLIDWGGEGRMVCAHPSDTCSKSASTWGHLQLTAGGEVAPLFGQETAVP